MRSLFKRKSLLDVGGRRPIEGGGDIGLDKELLAASLQIHVGRSLSLAMRYWRSRRTEPAIGSCLWPVGPLSESLNLL
jgi:hypothetical protein